MYKGDVEWETKMVSNLLYIDFVCCTLSLLLQMLPRCLAWKERGEESDQADSSV